MKAFLVASAVLLGVPGLARAGDARWLMCRGRIASVHLVVSAVEHRGADGASRDLSVMLIKGMNVATGSIVGKRTGEFVDKAAPIELVAHGRAVVTGKATLAQDFRTLTLTDKIDFDFGLAPRAAGTPFTLALACDELDDLAP